MAMSPAPMSTSGAGGGAVADTVTAAVPVLPPAAALTVAVPAATPVTRPDVETVATALFDELHVTPTADPDGVTVAVSCTVLPAATVALDGDTEIDRTFLVDRLLARDGASVSFA